MNIDFNRVFEELGITVPPLKDNYNPDDYAHDIYRINQNLNDIYYSSSSSIISEQESYEKQILRLH